MRNKKGQFIKGTYEGNGFKKGMKTWNKGKKCLYLLGNENGFKKGSVGEKNPSWKGGHDKYWKRQAKIRDDFTCQMCGLKEPEIMVTDHIRPKALRPDLQRSLDNLMTLCPNCHARKTKIDIRAIILFKKEKSYDK